PVRVGAGGFVAVPPYVAHSFVNASGADTRWLNFHAPDRGFADFLRTLRAGSPGQWDSFDVPADGGRPASDAIVCGPGDGENLRTGRRRVCIKGVMRDLCVAEWELDGPYAGPPVHRHDKQVDAFYVLDGELAPGSVEHAFNHRTDSPARVLNIRAPECGFAGVL